MAIRINVQNTGASTINVNSLGAKSVKKPNGSDVSVGNLKAGSIYTVRYNGTNFILQGSDSAGNATPGDVLSGKTFSNDEDIDLPGTMPGRTGHVAAQSISRSGISLRFRPQPGYYDGSTGNSVERGDANFSARNIRQGVTLFGLTGTLVPAPDDYRGAPGALLLTQGDINRGYFGRYTGIYTGDQLASAAGITIGKGLFYATSDIEWFKFAFEGKVIFLAQKPIRYAISWNDLNNAGCVYGTKEVTKDGITYRCRLLRIRNGEPETGPGREQYLLQRVHESYYPHWEMLTNEDLYLAQPVDTNGKFSLAQETQNGVSANCYAFDYAAGGSTVAKNDRYSGFSWRPVLEVV
ncbi:hypothetical protein SCFA_130003 [anaerobic digester metagenome]|uniref:Virion structural protein n=1 Tax=anaerobic digester metagenome TaxID=1263854 RepID=A0A485LUS7_9ZZZZ